jgi:DHA3 family tetracycline resistance protein-like MFS transporter
VGLPLLVTNVLRGGAALFGLIGAAGGVGEMLALVAIGAFSFRRPGVVIYAALLLSALSVAVFGLVPLVPAVLAAEALFAGGLVATNTLWESALQAGVPRSLLGRVSSVDWFGSLVAGAPAPLVAGLVLAHTTPGVVFVVSGLSAALVSVVVGSLPAMHRIGQAKAAAETERV